MTSIVSNLKMPSPWQAIRIVVTLGIFAALWQAVSGPEITSAINDASLIWLLAAVFALLVQTALSAQRWRVTAAQLDQHFTLSYALKEYFLSQAFNQALPGAVVGDAARAVRARDRAGLLVASQAVFFERLAGQVAMFLTMAVAFLATGFLAQGIEWPKGLSVALPASIGIGAMIGTCLVWLGLLSGYSFNLRLWMQPLTKALLARDVLTAQIVLGAAITLCNLAAFALAARAVGVIMSPIEIAALVPVILLAMLIPLTVSGWGLREGAAALVLPIIDISAADAVAASIVFGVAILISVIPAAVVVLKRS